MKALMMGDYGSLSVPRVMMDEILADQRKFEHETLDAGRKGSIMNRLLSIKPFRIEYEYQGRTYATVVDAHDRQSAMEQFKRDNPHVKLLDESVAT